VEDSQGQAQSLAKKAMLAMHRGEADVAEQLAARYIADRAFEVERMAK